LFTFFSSHHVAGGLLRADLDAGGDDDTVGKGSGDERVNTPRILHPLLCRTRGGTVLVPRHWQMQRNVWADKDGTIHVVVMGHADDAQFAELNGWLSEGIRLHLALPMRGRIWRNDGAAAWVRAHEREMMACVHPLGRQGQRRRGP
jgi:hypothetical protein